MFFHGFPYHVEKLFILPVFWKLLWMDIGFCQMTFLIFWCDHMMIHFWFVNMVTYSEFQISPVFIGKTSFRHDILYLNSVAKLSLGFCHLCSWGTLVWIFFLVMFLSSFHMRVMLAMRNNLGHIPSPSFFLEFV